MKLCVIGASAGVGLETVRQALEVGHTVTSLSRTVETLPSNSALTAIAGSALDQADVTAAVSNADAILVTLGTGASMKATTLYTDAAKVILDVTSRTNSSAPLIVITGFGAGKSAVYQNILMRIVMKLLLGKVYANKTEMEEMVAQSSLKWEIVRPGRLKNAERTGNYRVLTTYTKSMKIGQIARADVADYLLGEALNPVNLRRYPALTS